MASFSECICTSQSKIEFQNERNAFLERHIASLKEKIKEISELKAEKDRLLARTEKIQDLQSGRPDIVHLMDEVVATLPDGVYYTGVTQKGENLTVTGIAQSNARVSRLMRQMDDSQWMNGPDLVEIKADKGKNAKDEAIKSSVFQLRVKQTKTKKAGGEKEEDKNS